MHEKLRANMVVRNQDPNWAPRKAERVDLQQLLQDARSGSGGGGAGGLAPVAKTRPMPGASSRGGDGSVGGLAPVAKSRPMPGSGDGSVGGLAPPPAVPSPQPQLSTNFTFSLCTIGTRKLKYTFRRSDAARDLSYMRDWQLSEDRNRVVEVMLGVIGVVKQEQ